MIHKTWWRLLCVLLVITIGFISGCGLGKETKEAIKKMPQRITDMKSTIKKSQDQYAAFNKKSDFTFFAPYAKREEWNNWFAQANIEVTQAEKIYKDLMNSAPESPQAEIAEARLDVLRRQRRS